ncbi:MAG: Holliday junction branch migration protein RuvA [Parasporobacterium sp.]|nr:Holliday junction branch migration protein RuvA [Parasporobacterium sp.]
MISFIKGTVSYIGDTYIILENNHMGFQISMPSVSLYSLTEGMEVLIHTHLAVKEDDLSLYGFTTSEELKMFRLLIAVSGIGPKGALQILSSISLEELKMAIASGDAKLISRSKGIGLKTAQKLVVDLKGKFKNEVPQELAGSQAISGSNVETAILFAESTGISKAQCMKALAKISLPSDADVDTIIDLIFKNLNV